MKFHISGKQWICVRIGFFGQLNPYHPTKAYTLDSLEEGLFCKVSVSHLRPLIQDFYVQTRQDIYRQREVWRQHMVLYTMQKRSGGGAAVKTNFLREVLKRLSEEPRDAVPKDDVTAEDEALLQVTLVTTVDPTQHTLKGGIQLPG